MGLQKVPTEPMLKLLENGEWHYLKDVPQQTALNSLAVDYVVKFLAKYNFVKLDQRKQRIKLHHTTRKFFKTLQNMEKNTK